MAESEIQTQINAEESARDDRPPDVVEDSQDAETKAVGTAASDDTVGTGSAIALGCIAGTVLLIAIGLIVVLLSLILT